MFGVRTPPHTPFPVRSMTSGRSLLVWAVCIPAVSAFLPSVHISRKTPTTTTKTAVADASQPRANGTFSETLLDGVATALYAIESVSPVAVAVTDLLSSVVPAVGAGVAHAASTFIETRKNTTIIDVTPSSGVRLRGVVVPKTPKSVPKASRGALEGEREKLLLLHGPHSPLFKGDYGI